eukprot:GHUV01023952.1.p4 GENE.GHUV01023952.1~~GHUV01023952.1.p4  ORF type:complete len:129 (-),score=46.98 GHUV01023952.1:1477-1863(-)
MLAAVFHAAFNLPASYPASHIVTWMMSAPITSRHLLANKQLVVSLQLPGLGLAYAAAVDRLVKSDEGATAVVLQLVVGGLVDPTAVGQLTAKFSDSVGNIQSVQAIAGESTWLADAASFSQQCSASCW